MQGKYKLSAEDLGVHIRSWRHTEICLRVISFEDVN
jgi:hypothetical protein